jgi:hypothetical protein
MLNGATKVGWLLFLITKYHSLVIFTRNANTIPELCKKELKEDGVS